MKPIDAMMGFAKKTLYPSYGTKSSRNAVGWVECNIRLFEYFMKPIDAMMGFAKRRSTHPTALNHLVTL